MLKTAAAKKYAEVTAVRIEITELEDIEVVKESVEIKLSICVKASVVSTK